MQIAFDRIQAREPLKIAKQGQSYDKQPMEQHFQAEFAYYMRVLLFILGCWPADRLDFAKYNG
jgi:hypothetical protein